MDAVFIDVSSVFALDNSNVGVEQPESPRLTDAIASKNDRLMQ